MEELLKDILYELRDISKKLDSINSNIISYGYDSSSDISDIRNALDKIKDKME